MANPTIRASRAQHTYAPSTQQTHDECDDEFTTLDALLVQLYRAHDEHNPCTLSVAELAARFCPNAKPANGERSVRRAHERIAFTYGGRFAEIDRSYGRTTVTVARWIFKPGGRGRSRTYLSDLGSVDLRDLELRAKANARTRTRAPRERTPAEKKPPPRRPSRPHGVTNPAILAPLAWEDGVLAAVEARHGKRAAWSILRDLCRPRCHARPEETHRALRTLAERSSETPLKLFRHLLREALGGDQLIDRADVAAATRAAELEQLVGPLGGDVLERVDRVGAQLERLDELEDRLAAVHVSGADPERVLELERAIGALRGELSPARPPPVPPPAPTSPRAPPPVARAERDDPGAKNRFLAGLPEHLRAFGEQLDSS